MKKNVGTRLKNHKAIVSSKLNRARIDGEPHNPFDLLFAVGGVNARDELTKLQWLLLVIDHHGMRIGRDTTRALWGVFPMPDLMNPAPTRQAGRVVSETGRDQDKPSASRVD
jgi:hypothetical protein